MTHVQDHGDTRPTEQDVLRQFLDCGVREIISVPCSITDTWQWLAVQAARECQLNLVMTTHEGNLVGIATGIWLGTGRVSLVHMQNSGLFNAGDGFVTLAGSDVYDIPIASLVTWRGWSQEDTSEPHQAIGKRTDASVASSTERTLAWSAKRSGGALWRPSRF